MPWNVQGKRDSATEKGKWRNVPGECGLPKAAAEQRADVYRKLIADAQFRVVKVS